MEKITDSELKAMLTKEKDTPEEIIDEETGEVQWVKLPADTAFEDTPMAKVLNEELPLQDSLEQEIDFNTIPETVENTYEEKPLDPILAQRKDLTIGLTPEDLQNFFDYVVGKGEKPDFVDRFMADAEGRIKEMTMIMNMVQLSQIPTETALINQVTERLFDPNNLYDMDSKTLSATRSNLKSDISKTLETALKSIQVTSQYGSLNNEYRRILDGVMMLPVDKLEKVRSLLLETETGKIEK